MNFSIKAVIWTFWILFHKRSSPHIIIYSNISKAKQNTLFVLNAQNKLTDSDNFQCSKASVCMLNIDMVGMEYTVHIDERTHNLSLCSILFCRLYCELI